MYTGFGIVGYILICILVGFTGKEKKVGYWGTFFLSLLLSPLIGLIIALASRNKVEIYNVRCKYCGFVNKSNVSFCGGCGKNSEGLIREDFQRRANDPEYQKQQEEKKKAAWAAEQNRLRKRRSRNSTILIILFVAVAVSIVIALMLK
jgi:fucose permease